MRHSKRFLVTLLILACAPALARADLWVNVKAPLQVKEALLPAEGCELMNRTATVDTVRCSNHNTANEFNRVIHGGQIPGWRIMYFNDKNDKKPPYPSTCNSNFRYDSGNNRWDAQTGPFTGGYGCKQYWHNNNTLDVWWVPPGATKRVP